MEEPTAVELPLDRESGSVSRKLLCAVVVAMRSFSSGEFSSVGLSSAQLGPWMDGWPGWMGAPAVCAGSKGSFGPGSEQGVVSDARRHRQRLIG